MKRVGWRHLIILVGALEVAVLAAPGCAAEQPSAAATAGFDSYDSRVEARLAQQHRPGAEFLAGISNPQTRAGLKQGKCLVENLTPASGPDLPGAMLHHWRATAFVPGATGADFLRLMRDFQAYPQVYAPQVIGARVLGHEGDRYQVRMRVRQKHVITVVMDADYDVVFTELAGKRGFSSSHSTRIAEIDAPGTAKERALSPAEEHGILWRLNTYWSYEEADGGLYMQIESVSLTRSIPVGLGWIVRPFIASVPQESLEFTLQATQKVLRGQEARRER